MRHFSLWDFFFRFSCPNKFKIGSILEYHYYEIAEKAHIFCQRKYFENANLKALATIHERDFGISYLYSKKMSVCFIFFLL